MYVGRDGLGGANCAVLTAACGDVSGARAMPDVKRGVAIEGWLAVCNGGGGSGGGGDVVGDDDMGGLGDGEVAGSG